MSHSLPHLTLTTSTSSLSPVSSISPVFPTVEPRKIELDRNLWTDPYQTQERFTRSNFPNSITEDMDEFGKVGAEMSYIQSQMHSDYDLVESIARLRK